MILADYTLPIEIKKGIFKLYVGHEYRSVIMDVAEGRNIIDKSGKVIGIVLLIMPI